MPFFLLIVLAIIQGLTEFLPVSSSGHMSILQNFCGVGEPDSTLEVILHGGTLISVLIFYRQTICKLLIGLWARDKQAWSYAWSIVISCIPAGIFYFTIKDFLENTFGSPVIIACAMLVTALLLFSLKFTKEAAPGTPLTWWRALLIGCAQAIAMIPGISRSGSTFTASRWLGISADDSFQFSFLMSIPILAGAVILKLRKITCAGLGGGEIGKLAVAIVVAAVVGYLSLKFFRKCQVFGKVWYFSGYCALVGIGTLIALLLR